MLSGRASPRRARIAGIVSNHHRAIRRIQLRGNRGAHGDELILHHFAREKKDAAQEEIAGNNQGKGLKMETDFIEWLKEQEAEILDSKIKIESMPGGSLTPQSRNRLEQISAALNLYDEFRKL